MQPSRLAMTGTRSELSPGAWGWAWFFIGAAVCAAMVPLEPSFLEEGMMLHVGERVLAGEHLYRDMRLVTGPFPFALVAGLLALLGKNALAARAGVIALHALACGSVYGMARRASIGPWAHAAAACLAFAPVWFFPLLSTTFYATIGEPRLRLRLPGAARHALGRLGIRRQRSP
jgi:hypothetical protein